jgi:hypothetical protein
VRDVWFGSKTLANVKFSSSNYKNFKAWKKELELYNIRVGLNWKFLVALKFVTIY